VRTRVKICGITRLEDALCAIEQGADALGFVFVAKSPRCVSASQVAEIVAALPPLVTKVGLFMDASEQEIRQVLDTVPLDLLQFHGAETPDLCDNMGTDYIKAIPLGGGIVEPVAYAQQFTQAKAFLLDGHGVGEIGGQGKTFDWRRLDQSFGKPVILAGGLNPENVAEAIRQTRPYAVDVSSGVEAAKGIKDPQKMTAFLRNVREADKEFS